MWEVMGPVHISSHGYSLSGINSSPPSRPVTLVSNMPRDHMSVSQALGTLLKPLHYSFEQATEHIRKNWSWLERSSRGYRLCGIAQADSQPGLGHWPFYAHMQQHKFMVAKKKAHRSVQKAQGKRKAVSSQTSSKSAFMQIQSRRGGNRVYGT